MRTEQEMLSLILNYAMNDDRVRVVAMNGSRVNPNVPKDQFQDYDIVYLVTDLNSFICDPTWIDVFGERLIMQMPEAMTMFPAELGDRFSYLMQFADGTRLDLMLVPIAEKDSYAHEDTLTRILLDKDHCMPDIADSNDRDYWAKSPNSDYFADCCNEFWWVATYVAKGLWREEILYANFHLDRCVRPMLLLMLEWQVGIDTDFQLSVGKCHKYIGKYLPKQSWQKLLLTYQNGNIADIWQTLFIAIELFRQTAQRVAKHFNYTYPTKIDQQVTKYLLEIQHMHKRCPNNEGKQSEEI